MVLIRALAYSAPLLAQDFAPHTHDLTLDWYLASRLVHRALGQIQEPSTTGNLHGHHRQGVDLHLVYERSELLQVYLLTSIQLRAGDGKAITSQMIFVRITDCIGYTVSHRQHIGILKVRGTRPDQMKLDRPLAKLRWPGTLQSPRLLAGNQEVHHPGTRACDTRANIRLGHYFPSLFLFIGIVLSPFGEYSLTGTLSLRNLSSRSMAYIHPSAIQVAPCPVALVAVGCFLRGESPPRSETSSPLRSEMVGRET